MDVAKYIGLFLLKNKYCCLQGLGNLEIRKRPAAHDGTQLNGGSYDVVLQPTGSIDDALASFMATNEHVSIAKASNEIREFISFVKGEIAAGREVLIPSVGKYVNRSGAIGFELDPAFSLPTKPVAIPVAIRQPLETPQQRSDMAERSTKRVNWGLVAMWGVILVVVGLILFFTLRYFMSQPASVTQETAGITDTQMVEIQTPPPAPAVDSAALVQATDTPAYNFVISTYKQLPAAQRREKQLNGYGHEVHVLTRDSTEFFVVKTLKLAAADTTRYKDSLTRILNPAGVTILQ